MRIRQIVSPIVFTCCLGLLLSGCGASKAAKQKEAFIEAQKPVVVTKMGQEKAKLDATHRLVDKAIRDKDEEAKGKALELLEKLREEV